MQVHKLCLNHGFESFVQNISSDNFNMEWWAKYKAHKAVQESENRKKNIYEIYHLTYFEIIICDVISSFCRSLVHFTGAIVSYFYYDNDENRTWWIFLIGVYCSGKVENWLRYRLLAVSFFSLFCGRVEQSNDRF